MQPPFEEALDELIAKYRASTSADEIVSSLELAVLTLKDEIE